ncbi:helix-turn-helix transcriptional regulator [Kurthia zopfii]|uniref:helix-turn-helix transcriptional regulator n=1 Tax=Kurthia zopfii TaxID=1650 RepID=UPI000F6EF05B|nr:helix-turn-helix transcriptional regulator [Kurthia zopfii]VEI05583.1 putative molybdopterin biosynthesis protein MoeA/LysR substrate binding-domain-containing protein [Kurthia zopfii]
MPQDYSYTIEEVAQLLKVSKLTIYDLVKKEELPVYRVGRQMRVDQEDLQKYIQKSKTGSSVKEVATPKQVQHDSEKKKVIISGQDLVLDLLGKYIEKDQKVKILRSHEGSYNGVLAMYNGDCDIASMHMYDGDTGEYNTSYLKKIFVSHPYIQIHLLTRMAGFYVEKGNPLGIQSFEDITKPDLRIINREKGSGARTLLDEKLRVHEIPRATILGYEDEEKSHLDVASAVAQGHAQLAVGIEKIAKLVNVDFIPLVEESYDIVLFKSPENEQLVETVKSILQSSEFQDEVAALGGYSIQNMGKVIYESL